MQFCLSLAGRRAELQICFRSASRGIAFGRVSLYVEVVSGRDEVPKFHRRWRKELAGNRTGGSSWNPRERYGRVVGEVHRLRILGSDFESFRPSHFY
jgi:hypothetical protein